MDDATSRRISKSWRLAVWGLRVIGPGLAVVVIGLVALPWSTGTAQAILAVGMGIYLVGVVITVVGIVLVYREAPTPRPNFLDVRWSLLHDAVHARSASVERRGEDPGPVGEGDAGSPRMEQLRRSPHWGPAVWGVRVMGPGLALVVAGLITLLFSPSAGRPIVAVGVGIYLVSLVFTLVEVRGVYGDIQPPRPPHSRVQQSLLQDALHAGRRS
jgi:hypothetical protein